MAGKKTDKKETVAKPAAKNKNSRCLYNPEQTAQVQIYFNQDNHAINISKDGYHFSNDKEMDATVKYLKETYGLKEK